MIVQLVIWFIVFFVIIYCVIGHSCREGYADQMAHASVGGISGPMIDLGVFYEEPSLSEGYMYFPHTTENGPKLIKRGMGTPFAPPSRGPFSESRRIRLEPPTGNDCSQICENGYPKECPLGPKGCPYPCTGI